MNGEISANSYIKCHLCAPREADNDWRREIARLNTSSLYLFADQRFRGYCILIYDVRHETTLDNLSESEYTAFMSDLRLCSRALRTALNPDHMNFELLGNATPHLHWHIVPRYKSDPRWGQPIWEGWPRREFFINQVTLPESEIREMIESIRNQIDQINHENK